MHSMRVNDQVPFAGYSLPVQYKDSLINSHLHCRNSASLFDVSHMGQLRIWGEKRVEFLESVVVGDVQALEVNQMRLSVMTTEQGGIIDDCMIAKKQDHIYMVDAHAHTHSHCMLHFVLLCPLSVFGIGGCSERLQGQTSTSCLAGELQLRDTWGSRLLPHLILQTLLHHSCSSITSHPSAASHRGEPETRSSHSSSNGTGHSGKEQAAPTGRAWRPCT